MKDTTIVIEDKYWNRYHVKPEPMYVTSTKTSVCVNILDSKWQLNQLAWDGLGVLLHGITGSDRKLWDFMGSRQWFSVRKLNPKHTPLVRDALIEIFTLKIYLERTEESKAWDEYETRLGLQA